MRAAYYERQGPAQEVLQVGELPDLSPDPGEVRVRVAVSGLNPSDTKGRGGWAGEPMPFPRIIPHQDGAGVIDRVGPEVPGTRLGEWVWLYETQRGRAVGLAAMLAKSAGAHLDVVDRTMAEAVEYVLISAVFPAAHDALPRVGRHRGREAVKAYMRLLHRVEGAWTLDREGGRAAFPVPNKPYGGPVLPPSAQPETGATK